jgi:hypothetical protein
MKEPRRLREQSHSPIERQLLDVAASYRHPPGTRRKTLAALGLAGGAAFSAGTASGTASWLAVKLGSLKAVALLAAVGAGVATPVGVYVWQHRHPEPAAVTAPARRNAALPTRPPAPVVEPRAVEQAPEPLPPPARTVAQRKPKPKVEAPRVIVSSAPAGPSLEAEIAAIETARMRLRARDTSGALAALDQYAATYPDGRLRLEAEVLSIDALSKSGQTSAARARAQQFLQQHPTSVLAGRVRGYLTD